MRTFECGPNREDDFHAILTTTQPSIVVFDRFFAEEMFSFIVRKYYPDALRIIDQQDVHFLREARQKMAAKMTTTATTTIKDIVAHRPDATSSRSLLREIASIYRSDLTFVCSPVELQMLTAEYNIPDTKLALAPFFCDDDALLGNGDHRRNHKNEQEGERRHVMMIGTFRHPPNLDSVQWVMNSLWAILRPRLPPGTELHIYGSYPPPNAMNEFHKPQNGIYFKGFLPSLDVMRGYRLLLAPLRFGAGLKGKIVDAWCHGLPVCTTLIGSEGMTATTTTTTKSSGGGGGGGGGAEMDGWGGLGRAATAAEVVDDAATLYHDQELWGRCQQRGYALLRELYDRTTRLDHVHRAIEESVDYMQERRRSDVVGSILWEQQFRSTEYFSKWIELKETSRNSTLVPQSTTD